MKNLKQYHIRTLDIFSKFLNNNDKDELISNLCQIQSHYRSWRGILGTDRHIWFRFFKGDTGAWTINDIMHDLKDSNRTFLLECMQICVDKKEVEVYYS